MRGPEPAAAGAIALMFFAGAVFVPPAAWATDDGGLDSVERALADERGREQALESTAAALEHEIAALRLDLVDAARRAQDHEERVTLLETRLTDLARAEAETSAALRRRKEALAATLGALQRLARQPPEALMMTPAAIDVTIRTSLLLSATVPVLDGEARGLRDELEALAALHREIATQRLELEAATGGLAAERERLESLHRRKAALRRDTVEQREQAEQRVARLAAEAESLRELIDRLSATGRVADPPPPPDETGAAPPPPTDKPEAPEEQSPAAVAAPDENLALVVVSNPAGGQSQATRSISAARGSLPMPARGRLVGLFGQLSGGVKNRGISIETRYGARVVTPYDGEVVFAGPFRGYGQLLIIEHGEGYHTLLAGFSRIDIMLGRWLLAGEPVGVMGRGSSGNPVLYVELRRDGVAINPLPWLAASEKKVDG